MRSLSIAEIEALAVGAWMLGTGGGGSPYLGLLNMRRLYADGAHVVLMPPRISRTTIWWPLFPTWARRWWGRSG
jgi:DUF917 family protein